MTRGNRNLQTGAATVEFALVMSLFFLALLFGVIEMGRAFFYINGAAEATRLGARLAVVCDVSSGQQNIIRSRMQQFVSVLQADDIAFDYTPTGCASGTCKSVTVSILPGASFVTVIPFVPLTWSLPPFSTTLPTESLNSSNNSVCNP